MKFNFSIAGKSKPVNIPAGKINVKGNNIKCICAYCGKEFYVAPYIDENTLNNDIANLIPYNKSEHNSAHNQYKILIKDTKGRITGVVKQGELLENHNDNDNQQPSDDSNIVEGSTTNSRGVIDNANVSNANTSALPVNNGDDIV